MVKRKTFKDFRRDSNKVGGTKSDNDTEGIYRGEDGNAFLIKQDVRRGKVQTNKNIAEFLASKIFAAIAPGTAAEVSLVMHGNDDGPDKTGANVYVASKFFGGYTDLFIDVYKTLDHKKPEKEQLTYLDFRLENGTHLLSEANKKKQYKDFGKVMAPSLLIGDLDVHWGNVGVVEGNRLVRIDMGWAFRNIDQPIQPQQLKFSEIFHGAPLNRFRDYPDELKYSQDFVDELRKVANTDLSHAINDAMAELVKYYGPEPLKEFAQYVGIDQKALSELSESDDIFQVIAIHLETTLENRRIQLEGIANEIELGLCINPKTGEINKEKIRKFSEKNPEFYAKNLEEKNGKLIIKTELRFFYNVLAWLGLYDYRKGFSKKLAKVLEVRHTQSETSANQAIDQIKVGKFVNMTKPRNDSSQQL